MRCATKKKSGLELLLTETEVSTLKCGLLSQNNELPFCKGDVVSRPESQKYQ